VRRRAFPGTAASLAACSAPRLRDLGGQTSPTQAAYVPGVAAIVRTYGGHVPSLRAAAEIRTGARAPRGRSPVEIPGRLPIGAGLS